MTDFSFEANMMKEIFIETCGLVRDALIAPHVLYKPTLSQDGDQWCALFGENLAEGVAGFGDTPAEAMAAFDKAWRTQRTNYANLPDRQNPLCDPHPNKEEAF